MVIVFIIYNDILVCIFFCVNHQFMTYIIFRSNKNASIIFKFEGGFRGS